MCDYFIPYFSAVKRGHIYLVGEIYTVNLKKRQFAF